MNAVTAEVTHDQFTGLIPGANGSRVERPFSRTAPELTGWQKKIRFRPAESPVDRDDVNLAVGISQGNLQFEEEFVRKYRQRLVLMLIRLTKDVARAEDLTHEALILVLKKLRSNGLNEPENLRAYAFSTARYVYFGWLRKHDNQVELRDGMDEFLSALLEPEEEYISHQNRNNLRCLINTLPVERDREILSRQYLQNQTKIEICEAMFLTPAHFNRVISRARTRLREYVASMEH
jgi:RNA polymerase sigma-70 factor (ECF subfamily)